MEDDRKVNEQAKTIFEEGQRDGELRYPRISILHYVFWCSSPQT